MVDRVAAHLLGGLVAYRCFADLPDTEIADFATPERKIMMFDGLMPRCTTPSSWA